MHMSENEVRAKIMEDAIRTALRYNRIIEIQKGIITVLVGAVIFLLSKEV